ncbi:hypothetical protein PCCS19_42510 [Paenibacillus sp. CCS19]|nr:hypothetical protein PCCS19_42510 [Paenibacillus cellulosilyticus]
MTGMHVAAVDEDGFACSDDEVIGIDLEPHFTFQDAEELRFLVPMCVQYGLSRFPLD